MKKIFLIRHAKSGWISADNDFSRTLNETGKKEALQMSEKFSNRNMAIDLIICSSAFRTIETASVFAKGIKYNNKSIVYKDELYLATAENFNHTLINLEEIYNTVMIIGHNPGLTDFVNSLITDVKIDDMPTAGIFAVESDATKWENFKSSKKKFLFFDYPKVV